MPNLDITAKAAVNSHFAVAWFIFLDIDTDPLRVCTRYDRTFGASETGDSDLDGHTFVGFGGELVDVGDVNNSDSGSDTLEVTLSGIVGLDTTLLDDIGEKSKWQGRTARLWFQIYDPTGVTPQGAIVQYYTGYMSSVQIVAQAKAQTIKLSIENYLAFTTQASERSYLKQSDYDALDTSAAATIAAANGLRSSSGGGGAVAGGANGTGGGGTYANLPISIGRQNGG